MWIDFVLQAAIILSMLSMFLFAHSIPQNLFAKLRLFRRRSEIEAKRHFVAGAQLLSTAASAADARRVEGEADRAIALDPADAASHILKALALELQGFRTSALASMDVALSPLAAKTLTAAERADALLKRAELRSQTGGGDGDGGAVEDLLESVRLKGDNAKAYDLLGRCYEKKGSVAAARNAFRDAIRVRPDYVPALDALTRLEKTNSL